MVAIDETCNAIPGFPRIKLWQDSADKLNIDTSGLRRIRPGLEKFDLPLGRAFHADPLPVKWIYILQTHEKQEFALEAINGLDRFLPLRANTYRMRLVQGMELEASHLKLCGNLAGRIRLAYIYRPKSGFDLNKLVEFIKADVAEHP